ncbi:MAG: CotH kinase family protein [Chitinispirillaceae bacterium]|nr:CotH kinase family protein [Chitinispirillaceae bacterium]
MKRSLLLFCALVLVGPLISNGFAQVKINEFLANNVSVNPDNVDYDDFSDWVELYNSGSSAADIGGYYLTGDFKQPKKWQIPSGTSVPANGYLLIWCDDHNAKPGTSIPAQWYGASAKTAKYYHSNFCLDKEGEQVALFNASGAYVDSVTFGQQFKDVSMGRTSDGKWAFFDEPTPAAANSTTPKPLTTNQVAGAVVFSVAGGFYSSAQTVTLTAADGSDIYYTTDCSIPFTKDTKYSGPISVSKTTAIRARCITADKFPGKLATNTYFIDDKRKLMAVSIVSEPAFLFDNTIGIYKNSRKGFEVPISVEFFTTDGKQAVKANAGVRLGSLTNYGPEIPQKPLQIALRNRYGDPFVNYQFYAKPVTKFDRFRLRDGGDVWNTSVINDALLDPICKDQTAVGYQAFRAAVVYINGAFYGIQDLREQFKDMYFAENYGVADPAKRDEVRSILLASGGMMGGGEGWEIVNGTDARKSLISTIKSDASKYKQLIDAGSMVDFFALIDFAKAISWGHNQDMWTIQGGKWRWLVTDFDRGWVYSDTYSGINLNQFVQSAGVSPKIADDEVLKPLLTNTEFKNYFIQRYAAHLNSTLKTTRLNRIVDSIANIYSLEMAAHVAKWGNKVKSVSGWQSEITTIKKFMSERPKYAWQHLEASPFGASGGRANLSVTLSPSSAKADIFVSGVRMSEGLSNISLYKNISFTVKAVGKPGWQCSGWEGGGSADSMTVTLSGDKTVTAKFGEVPVNSLPVLELIAGYGVIDRAVAAHGSISLTLDCSFAVGERLDVGLFDLSGRKVENMMDAEVAAGTNHIHLSTKRLASGVYYYRIRTGTATRTRVVTVP